MAFFHVSLWPVLLAAGINMVLGMLWYGPLFGKSWMALAGYAEADRKDMGKEAGPGYAASLIASLITGFALDWLFGRLTMSFPGFHLGWALCTGALLWLGFAVPAGMKPLFWERRPKGLFFINTGFELTGILLISLTAYFL